MFVFFLFPFSLVFFSMISISGFVQASLSGGRRSSTGGDISPVWYPQPYDVMTYIRDFSSGFDTQRFYILPCSGSAISIPPGSGARDTDAGASRKRWNH